ncbi:hypothetical protein BASA82_000136 [Batrachochytrium salamandrivorans]|nr:hypothetical protein BASA82_000136 [Batrachochytrium salamandrivorans]
MAEGRSATLLFQLQKRGFNVTGSKPDDMDGDDGFVTVRLSIPRPWMMVLQTKSLVKALTQLFINRLFPSSMATFFTVQLGVVLTTVFAESDSWLRSGWLADLLWKIDLWANPLKHLMSVQARVAMLAASASLLGFFMIVAAERFLLRVLLSFGPQFIQMSRSSTGSAWLVSLWKMVIGSFLLLGSPDENNIAATQLCLPSQPVPWLRQTVDKVLKSVEPVLSELEFATLTKLGKEFLRSEGIRLNLYLRCRAFLVSNYCTPWFERYVYLSHRASLLAGSNYYVMDCATLCPVKDQVFRAANLCHHLCVFSEMRTLRTALIHNGTIPLCMKQYDKLFATCRVPGRQIDSLKTNRQANHVVVIRKGRYYKLKVRREGPGEEVLSPAEFAHQLRLICEHATIEAKTSRRVAHEADVAALTTLPRTQWAEIRDTQFGEGRNRKSLLAVENALFVVHLVSEQGPMTSALDRAKFLFYGDGASVWCDKSFNLLVFENGLAGLNCEISFGDAPTAAHMWEYALLHELIDFENSCDASALAGESLRGQPLPMPYLLDFSVSPELAQQIKQAKQQAVASFSDSQLEILHCSWLGRDGVKHKLRLSPDAFIQLCLVFTTYLDLNRKPSLAYESCHLRMFREGRTEAIRSLTSKAKQFIEYMTGTGQVDLSVARALCRDACLEHSKVSLDSCTGRGVDSHLFALNVAAKGLDIKSEFLDFLHNKLTWSISSSQQPQAQTKLRELLSKEMQAKFVSTGGGYAPISPNGYGVAYTLTEGEMFFHITCEKSKLTNCKRFKQTLERVLRQVSELMIDSE